VLYSSQQQLRDQLRQAQKHGDWPKRELNVLMKSYERITEKINQIRKDTSRKKPKPPKRKTRPR
jgi:hypothetical protein